MALTSGWSLAYRVQIQDKLHTPYHRMLLGLAQKEMETEISSLTLKQQEGSYTNEFIALIQPFYLKY